MSAAGPHIFTSWPRICGSALPKRRRWLRPVRGPVSPADLPDTGLRSQGAHVARRRPYGFDLTGAGRDRIRCLDQTVALSLEVRLLPGPPNVEGQQPLCWRQGGDGSRLVAWQELSCHAIDVPHRREELDIHSERATPPERTEDQAHPVAKVEVQTWPMGAQVQVGFTKVSVAKANFVGALRKILTQNGPQQSAAEDERLPVLSQRKALRALLLVGRQRGGQLSSVGRQLLRAGAPEMNVVDFAPHSEDQALVKPCCSANNTSWPRWWRLSLWRMLLTWLPTVFGLMAQSRATCFVLRPLAIRVRMSRSRSLNRTEVESGMVRASLMAVPTDDANTSGRLSGPTTSVLRDDGRSEGESEGERELSRASTITTGRCTSSALWTSAVPRTSTTT